MEGATSHLTPPCHVIEHHLQLIRIENKGWGKLSLRWCSCDRNSKRTRIFCECWRSQYWNCDTSCPELLQLMDQHDKQGGYIFLQNVLIFKLQHSNMDVPQAKPTIPRFLRLVCGWIWVKIPDSYHSSTEKDMPNPPHNVSHTTSGWLATRNLPLT